MLVVLTDFPSPYQVEYMNALSARQSEHSIVVVYRRRLDPSRTWEMPSLLHDHCFLDQPRGLSQAADFLRAGTLAVFSWYRDSRLRRLMAERDAAAKPWCFWGERPGFSLPRPLGYLYRRWRLHTLHNSRAPVWGIGAWAVEAYRNELGTSRLYFDVPYCSDLARFSKASLECMPGAAPRTILYSGSLIPRKGVRLLANAFLEIASEFPDTRLEFLGDGPLRPVLAKLLERVLPRVSFHGFKPWSSLPEYYARASILCAPSLHDGWCLAVPEALASGMLVVGTDRTGAALDLLRPGSNGWIAKAGSLPSLVLALRAALRASSSTTLRRQRATAFVSEHSLERGVQRFLFAAEGTLRGPVL